MRAWGTWKEEAQLTNPDDFAYKPLPDRWHTVMDGGLDPETIRPRRPPGTPPSTSSRPAASTPSPRSGLTGAASDKAIPLKTEWITMTLNLRWSEDGWKLVGFDQKTGLTPEDADPEFGEAPQL
ncbi:hypothetical protein HEP87_64685 [Streptomyces sp. S1D4-11]|nr:hypothetical protein [Streptomyces sp. S1D4-11]